MRGAKSGTAVPLDVFRDLLEDWRVSLRARGGALATIASYITVGEG
ncbi:MAG: hypothetical protein QOF95_1465, partial [Pseudonocardiales bacterium]|nr:hypothetical protein [Pseudonocardiales bacterium]